MKFLDRILRNKNQVPLAPHSKPVTSPLILALEPRIMFDAAAVATVAAAQDAGPHAEAPVDHHNDNHADNSALLAPPATGNDSRHEVVFVDKRVPGYESLLPAIRDGVDVVFLDTQSDGLKQISDYLSQHPGYDSVHIISHGSAGTLELGSALVNFSSLNTYQSDLQKIGSSMAAGGDVLLYGCDVAQGEAGKLFVNTLSTIMGRDVAASTDDTGSSTKGGDWNLELHVGDIYASTALTPERLQAFQSVLASSTKVYYITAGGAGSTPAATDTLGRVDNDATGNTSVSTAVAGNPSAVAIDIANNRAFVSDSFTGINTIFQVNLTTGAVTTFASGLPGTPNDLKFDSATGDLYAVTAGGSGATPAASDAVIKINSAGTVVSNFGSVVGNASGLALDLANNRAFVSDSFAGVNKIVSVNLSTGAVSAFVTTSNAPAALQMDTINNRLYFLTNGGAGSTPAAQDALCYVDLSTSGITTVATAVAGNPTDLALDLGNNRAIITDSFTGVNKLVSVNLSTGAVSDFLTGTTSTPVGIAITDTSVPTFDPVNSSPADNATGIAGTSNIQLKFSEVVYKGSGGNFVIRNVTDNTTIETIPYGDSRVTGWGTNTLTIDPSATLAGGKNIAVQWSANSIQDGFGNYAAANSGDTTFNFTTVAPNTAPTVANLNGDSVSFIEGGGALLLDSGSNATVTDGDSSDFNGGNMTVSIVTNRVGSEDVLGIRNQGTSAGQIGVSGSNVTFGGTTIGTFTGGTGTNDLVITFNSSANAAAAQALARNLTYNNSNGTDPGTSSRTVRVTVNDGDGGTSSNNDITVNVTRVNDAPTLSATGSTPTFTEGGSSVDLFSGVSISTVDSGQSIDLITLTVTNVSNGSSEVLSIDGSSVSLTNGNSVTTATNGMTVTVAVAGSTATVSISKSGGVSTAAAQTLVDGISYNNTSDSPDTTNRVVTLTSVRDTGGTSNSGVDTTSLSIASTVTVVAVNDQPVATAPATIAVTEDVTTALTGISFSDVDAGSSSVTVTLSVGSGTLAATSGGGVTVGGSSSALTLTGSIANINTFIAGSNVTFTTATNATSNVTLTTSIDDGGNTGTGGAKTDSKTTTLQVSAVNDAPVATAPATIAVTEDVTTALTGISFSDVDAGSGSVTVTLSIGSGALAATSGGGVTVGGSSSALTLTGSSANINTFIAGSNVTFTTAANATSNVTLTTSINDNGNTGSGGAQTDSKTTTLQVTAANDAPVATAPATITVTEDVAGAITGISFSDVDAGSGSVTVTLSIGSGTLAATSGGGVTVGGTSTALTLTGSIANINTFIAGSNVTFTTAANATANVTLTTSINDGGNTGSGGAQTDSKTTTIQVTAVNDAPVLTPATPALTTINEDATSNGGQTVASFLGSSVSDVDASALQGIAITGLNSGNGTWEYSTNGGGNWSAVGSVSTGNALLLRGTDLVRFVPNDQNGTTGTLSYKAWDQTSGTAGNKVDASATGGSTAFSTQGDTASITVTNINDAPTLSGGPYVFGGTDEDTTSASATVNTILGSTTTGDVDAGAVKGIAVTASTGSGSWEYSTDGTTWTAFGAVSGSNALLLGASTQVRYVPNGVGETATLSFRAWDQTNGSASSNGSPQHGNTGSNGGNTAYSTGTASASIAVTGINDAPVVNAPASITVTEDVASALSGLSFSDVDAASGNVTVTLSVGSGTLAATSGSGVTVGGTATALTLTGTVTDINAFIAASSVTFTTAANATANVTLTASIDDGGNTGTGGALTDSETITLQVTAVNDAPVATAPATITVTEDVAGAITGISFSDVDAGSSSVTVTLSVGSGTLAATSGGGVTVGGTSSALTLTGSIANINTFIAGSNVSFTTAANATSNVTLTTSINDGGNTGSGGAQTDSKTTTIQVSAVNDAPVATAPANISVTEDVASALTGISFSDVDAGSSSVTVTLSIGSGTLAATSGGGVAVGGTATTLTLTGSIANINTFIAGSNVTFTTATNATSNVTLTTSIDDGGNTGSGGAKTDSKTTTLQVTAVNDAPVATAPATITVTEDVAGAITGISFSDVDAGSSSVTVTLSVGSGTLAATSGGGVTIGGTSSALTLTGSIANINTFIAGSNVSFTTAANATANVTLTTSINDNGNTGTGGAQTDSKTSTIQVTAVNDAPVTTTSGGTTAFTEGNNTTSTPVVIDSGLSVSDVDNATLASATVSITGNFQNGQDVLAFTNDGSTMGNITASYSSSTGILTLTSSGALATKAEWQSALRSVTYTNSSETPNTSNRTISFAVNDSANGSNVATKTVSVAAVNDTPVVTAPANISVTEDVAGALTGISFSDADAGSASVTATLSVGSGTLAATSGGSVTIAGSGTGTLTLTGSIANINAFIAASNVTFTTATNASSNVTLTSSINDGGNSGGSAQTDSKTTTLQVTAVNDAPVVTAPATISVTEDVAGTLTGISFSDVDAGSSSVTVTLSVGSGTLAASSGSGVTVGGSSTALTLTGSIANINAFIAASNVSFTTAANATSNVTLTTSIDDGGNTGTGGAKTDSKTTTLQVTAVNDAPAATAPATITVTEDVASSLTGISFSDVDAGSSNVTVTLSVGSGTLAATSGSGVTVGGTSTALTLTGSIANINAFIAASNVSFTTAANATSNVTLTTSINDGGNTGTGGALTDSKTTTLQVTAVNDAPVATVPANISVTEDVASALTGISFSDVDSGSSSVTVTLSVGSGALAATSGSGVTVGGSSTALTLTGSIANINAFIAASNVSFTTAANATANVTLTTSIDDGGNTGTGGAKTDSKTTTLQVTAVNDAPVTTAPATITVTEDVAAAITGISFSDVDAGGSNVTVTLSIGSGSLAATSGSGVTVGGTSTALTLTGSIANINAFIAASNISFSTAANATGNVTLTTSINDNGNTGSGGALTDSKTTTLQVTAVNDAPVATVPANISVTEDVASALTGISFNDLDAGSSNVTVTLSVGSGTLAATSGGGVTVGGSSSALTLTGSIANINAFIAGSNVSFTTAANATSNVTLTTSINDNGNTGTGGALTDSETTTLQVTAVNDAPVATVPANISVTEDVASALTGISFSDVDAGSSNVTVTLSVGSGALAATSGSGVTVGGSSSALTLTGSISNINAFIAASNVSFTTAANATGNVTLTTSINDGGNTGTGGALTDSETTTLQVTAVNDAPVVTAPATIGVTEDVASALTGISFSDVDAGGSSVTVTLSVGAGTLAATSGGGVTVGGISSALTLTGNITDINAFIAASNISYTSVSNATTNETLHVAIDDGGNTGTGGAKTDAADVTLDIAGVNDAPVVTGSGGTTAFVEGNNVTSTPVVIDSGLTLSDVDNTTQASATVSITGNFQNGQDVLAFVNDGSTMGNIAASYNSATGVLTLTSSGASASNAEWQAALRSVTYTNSSETPNTSTRTISFVVNDGTDNSNAATKAVSVAAVNDAPIVSGGTANQHVNDNATIAPFTDILISDTDNATLGVVIKLDNDAKGTLINLGGFTFNSGNDRYEATGTPAQLQAWIQALVFQPTENRVTPGQSETTFFIIGVGDNLGAANVSMNASVISTSLNDAPVISGTVAGQTVNDNATLSPFSGVTIADTDSPAQNLTVQLILDHAENGVLSNLGGGSYNSLTGIYTFTGTASAATAAIQGLVFTPTGNQVVPGSTVTSQFSLTVNDGASGLDADATTTVIATSINDAPGIGTSGGSAGFVEGQNTASVPVTIDSGLTVVDPDSGSTLNSATVAITGNFHSAEDVLAFTNNNSTNFGDISASYNSGTGVLTLSSAGGATLAQWQSALRAVTYNNSSDTPDTATRTISFQGNDGSATGTVQTRTVTVNAVNDAPVVTAPATISVTEDVTGALTGISFSDVDAGSASVTATLSVGSGTLAATSGSGVTVGGTSTALTLTGSIANINAFIAASNVSFTTASNATADVTLSTSINDGGNTGTGGAQTDSTTTTLQVTAVNDAPNITAPGSIAVNEDVVTAVTGISFSDVDTGAGNVTVNLSVASGSLSASSGSGVTVSGSGTGLLTLTGSIADINSFIAGSAVNFVTASNATANVTLSVSIDDGGNTGTDPGNSGTGSSEAASTTVTLAVTAVNDAPVNSLPASQSLDQDSSLTFNTGNGNLISISDVDAGGGNLRITLTATNGLLNLSGTSGLTFSVGSGSGDTTMTFEGTAADINAALNGLSFSPTGGYNGPASLEITTNDLGLNGSGGVKTDTDTINITVDPINPLVTTVQASSPNGGYKIGDTINVTVTFDQVVNVTGGNPTLLLETGATDRLATYVSGSGTNTLTFSYTVQAGDNTADLDYVSTSALSFNGATIESAGGDTAILTLPTVGGADSIAGQDAIVVDGIVPTVSSVSVPVASRYNAGDVLTFTVNASEAVTVGGTPRLTLDIGGSTAYASYVSGSGTTLTFQYTVQPGDTDSNGIALGGSLDLNGGTVRDAVGNDLTLTLNSVGDTSGVIIDTTAPAASGIVRVNANPTNAASVSYTVTFSEDVSGVDASDFTLVSSGSAAGTIASVTQVDAHTYTVVVSGISGDGSLGLNLNGSGTGILDVAGNAIGGGLAGEVYTVDRVAPAPSGIVRVNANPTNAASVSYTVTFSEDVSGVDASDFTLVSAGSAAGTIASVTQVDGHTYTVVVNGISGDGSLGLNLKTSGTGITDGVGNAISGGLTGQVYTVDRVAPAPSGIVRVNANPTNAASVSYTVTFSENVSGVDASDFTLVSTGSAAGSIASVTQVDGHTYTVVVNGISGDGSLGLNLKTSGTGIADGVGNAVSGGLTGEVYTVDRVAPTASGIVRVNASPTNAASVSYTVTFSENVSGVNAADFTLVSTGSAAGSIASVTQVDGHTYTVVVNGISGDGSLGLNLKTSGTGIADGLGNAISGGLTGEVYAVDRVAPTPSSIVRNGSSPTTSDTLTFTVTFSENVTGVTLNDFTLSKFGLVQGSLSGLTQIDGHTYRVTVSNVAGIGQIGLNLNNSGTGIQDQTGNALMGGLTGPSYSVLSLPFVGSEAGSQALGEYSGEPDRAPQDIPLITLNALDGFTRVGRGSLDDLSSARNGDRAPVKLATLNSTYIRFGNGSKGLGLLAAPSLGRFPVAAGRTFALNLPDGTFSHNDSNARLLLDIRQSNGKPLPGWVDFDPLSGSLRGRIPDGFTGRLSLDIRATDEQGHAASTQLELEVKAPTQQASTEPAGAAPAAKPALEAQFAQYGNRAFQQEQDALREHLLAATTNPATAQPLPPQS